MGSLYALVFPVMTFKKMINSTSLFETDMKMQRAQGKDEADWDDGM